MQETDASCQVALRLQGLLHVLRAPWLTALGPCLQFHDICFGGAPAMGHQEPELLDAVFPSFELRFADVRLLAFSVPPRSGGCCASLSASSI